MRGNFLAATFLVMAATAVRADDARDLAERNYAHNRVADSTAALTMTLTNKSGDQRVRKLTSMTRLKAAGGDNMRLLAFEYPADVKGTTTLLIENTGKDDDMWIYLPALRKVRRLVAQNKRDAFVGSDLTFGDILGHKPADWDFRVVKEDSVDTTPVTVLEALPKSSAIQKSTGYSIRQIWIDPKTGAALRTDYFDEAGQLIKTVTTSDLRVVDATNGKTQFMRIEALNVQTGGRTTMLFDSFRANVGVDPELFSPATLEPQ